MYHSCVLSPISSSHTESCHLSWSTYSLLLQPAGLSNISRIAGQNYILTLFILRKIYCLFHTRFRTHFVGIYEILLQNLILSWFNKCSCKYFVLFWISFQKGFTMFLSWNPIYKEIILSQQSHNMFTMLKKITFGDVYHTGWCLMTSITPDDVWWLLSHRMMFDDFYHTGWCLMTSITQDDVWWLLSHRMMFDGFYHTGWCLMPQ